MAKTHYEEITESEAYKKLIAQIPEQDRETINASIREMCLSFEKTVIAPLHTYLSSSQTKDPR